MNRLLERTFTQFLALIGGTDTFAYKLSNPESGPNKLIIYTTKPGIWIGKGGSNIDKLKELVKKELMLNQLTVELNLIDNFVITKKVI